MLVNRRIVNFIIFALLFLFGIGFLGKQTYIILLVGGIVLLFSKKGRIKESHSFSLLMLLAFSAFCILFASSISPTAGLKSVCCLVAFYIGSNLNCKKEDSLKRLLLFLAFSFALYPVINFFFELTQFGFSFSFLNSVTHYDVWSKEDSAVTLIVSNACLLASLFGFFIFYCKKKKLVVLGLLIIGVVAFYDLILGGRTFLFIILIMLFFEAMLVILSTKKGLKKVIKRLLVLSLILSLVVVFLVMMFDDFKSAFLAFFENTHFFSRFGETGSSELLKTSRWNIRNEYLSLFWDNPFGGRAIFKRVGMLPHELWLDVYDISGIFSWVPFMLYFVASVVHIVKFCLNRGVDKETKNILICCFVGLLMQFAVEPIFSGNPALLFVYCLIDGAVISYSNRRSVVNTSRLQLNRLGKNRAKELQKLNTI